MIAAAVPLDETVNDLHITAARKLQELIQTVQDPQLLSRLIATALRFKLPKRPAPEAAPSSSSTHSTPSSPSPRHSLTSHQDPAPSEPPPAAQPPEPPFLPGDSMPYRQYELLHKQLGGEGARRRQREYREQRRAERLARAAQATAQAAPPDLTQSASTPASNGSD